MIYWIDDEEMILDLVSVLFKNVEIIKCNHWSKIPELKIGDVVFHDHDGVGEMPQKVEGVRYFRCSGTIDESVHVDFKKPFDIGAIQNILKAS